MLHERRRPLSDDEIDRIATAVAEKTNQAFHIENKKHYDDHQRLDALLKVYEEARNIIWKGFLSLVIIGAIFLAGIGIVKGGK